MEIDKRFDELEMSVVRIGNYNAWEAFKMKIKELRKFTNDTIATLNAKHQKLILEEHRIAREMAIEECMKMLEESQPGAWFPGGALELKKKFLDEVLFKLQALKEKHE